MAILNKNLYPTNFINKVIKSSLGFIRLLTARFERKTKKIFAFQNRQFKLQKSVVSLKALRHGLKK